jgi:hypothetical protein
MRLNLFQWRPQRAWLAGPELVRLMGWLQLAVLLLCRLIQ